jgi:hypothetical protein
LAPVTTELIAASGLLSADGSRLAYFAIKPTTSTLVDRTEPEAAAHRVRQPSDLGLGSFL